MFEENDNIIPDCEVEVCTFENCKEKVLKRCKQCSLNFCLDHASEVDPTNFCVNCLVPQDAEFTESPLIDREGTTHKGRIIRPMGKAYRLSAKMVFEMNDDELKDYLREETETVHQLENVREYHRINLGAAEAEMYRRELSGLSKVGGVLRWGTSTQRVPAIREKKARAIKTTPTGNKVDDLVGMLGQLGMTPEALAKLIASIPAKKSK